MFERLRRADAGNGTAVRERRQQWAERSRRRYSDFADAERIDELRWQWRCACESSDIAGFVYTPSGVTRPIPQITQIELGPPVALTIHVRPGQSANDFIAAAPTIASALNVAAVQVTQIRPSWLLRIVLLP